MDRYRRLSTTIISSPGISGKFAVAHSGTIILALLPVASDMIGIRNFVRTRLLCGLRAGNKYKLEMFVFSKNDILDSVGIYFSEQDYLFERRYFRNISTAIMVGRWNEVKVIRTLLAGNGLNLPIQPDGTEGYITLGNFKQVDYEKDTAGLQGGNTMFSSMMCRLLLLDTTEKLCFAADSVKAAIYAESERHNILENRVMLGRRDPPPVMPLPKTTKTNEIVETIEVNV